MDRFIDTRNWEIELGNVVALITESFDTENQEFAYEVWVEVDGVTEIWESTDTFEQAQNLLRQSERIGLRLRYEQPTEIYDARFATAS